MKTLVIWCKWSLLSGFYRLHYRTFRNKERAEKYINRIKRDKRKFIWEVKEIQ